MTYQDTRFSYTVTGTLCDSETAEDLRDATPEEVWESVDAGRAGHILVDGRQCYVMYPRLSVTWGDYSDFSAGDDDPDVDPDVDRRLTERLSILTGRDLTDCGGGLDESAWYLDLADLADHGW